MTGLLLMALVATASLASAQTAALSATAGVLVPASPFVSTPVVAGAFEIYLSPRVSLRPSVSWAEPAVSDSTASLRRVGLGWDALYHWNHGTWQPFVGIGGALHAFQRKVGGRAVGPDDEVNFGVTVTGGLEVWVSHRTTITSELTYWAVEQGRVPQSPSAIAVRGGIKQYF